MRHNGRRRGRQITFGWWHGSSWTCSSSIQRSSSLKSSPTTLPPTTLCSTTIPLSTGAILCSSLSWTTKSSTRYAKHLLHKHLHSFLMCYVGYQQPIGAPMGAPYTLPTVVMAQNIRFRETYVTLCSSLCHVVLIVIL